MKKSSYGGKGAYFSPKFELSALNVGNISHVGASQVGTSVFSISCTLLVHFRLCCLTPSLRYPFPLSLAAEMWPFWNCSLHIPASASKKKPQHTPKKETKCNAQQPHNKNSPSKIRIRDALLPLYSSPFLLLHQEEARNEREVNFSGRKRKKKNRDRVILQ